MTKADNDSTHEKITIHSCLKHDRQETNPDRHITRLHLPHQQAHQYSLSEHEYGSHVRRSCPESHTRNRFSFSFDNQTTV